MLFIVIVTSITMWRRVLAISLPSREHVADLMRLDLAPSGDGLLYVNVRGIERAMPDWLNVAFIRVWVDEQRVADLAVNSRFQRVTGPYFWTDGVAQATLHARHLPSTSVRIEFDSNTASGLEWLLTPRTTVYDYTADAVRTRSKGGARADTELTLGTDLINALGLRFRFAEESEHAGALFVEYNSLDPLGGRVLAARVELRKDAEMIGSGEFWLGQSGRHDYSDPLYYPVMIEYQDGISQAAAALDGTLTARLTGDWAVAGRAGANTVFVPGQCEVVVDVPKQPG